jgi:hypothetical protein
MNAPLIFEAICNRRVIGVVIVQDGVASARVGHMSLNGTLLGHALMWIREHNPDAFADVEFRLALGNAIRDTSGLSRNKRLWRDAGTT